MDVDIKKVDKSQVKAFFAFDLLVLPSLVKIGFILGIIGILLSGISLPFRMAIGFSGKFDFGSFVIGCVISIVMIPLGLIGLRVVCESMIVVFKIREDLAVLLGGKPPATPAPATPPEPEKPPAPPSPSTT